MPLTTNLRSHEITSGIYYFQIFALDREQAIKRFKEEFKNDPDIDKVRITRTTSKNQQDSLEKLYTLFFRLDIGFFNRPKCEECGSGFVISRGKEWYCRTCGHYWSKIRRKKS